MINLFKKIKDAVTCLGFPALKNFTEGATFAASGGFFFNVWPMSYRHKKSLYDLPEALMFYPNKSYHEKSV